MPSLKYRADQDILYRFCCHRLIVIKDVALIKPEREYEFKHLMSAYSNWYRGDGLGGVINVDFVEKMFLESILKPYLRKIQITDDPSGKKLGSVWVNGVRDSHTPPEGYDLQVPEPTEMYMANMLNDSYLYTKRPDKYTGTELLQELIDNAAPTPIVKKKTLMFRPMSLF